VAQEAQALPSGDFQNAVFHPAGGGAQAGAAHETLLKASMPASGVGLKTVGQTPRRRSRRVSRPAMQRAKTIPNQTQQWVVLTSWDEASDGAKLVLTVAREQTFSPSYAVVPTAGGWLIFQL
jgi:hypothetical protein